MGTAVITVRCQGYKFVFVPHRYAYAVSQGQILVEIGKNLGKV